MVFFQVTLVNNLEAYGINIEEFSRECQKGVAASATINQINGMKGSQLQIQGNQVNFLEKILTGKREIIDRVILILRVEKQNVQAVLFTVTIL